MRTGLLLRTSMRISLVTCLLLFCSHGSMEIEGNGTLKIMAKLMMLENKIGILETENEMMKIETEKIKNENEKIKNGNKEIIDVLEERVGQLEDLMKVSILRSCAEYSRHGLRTSGRYMIDPDGKSQGQEPFQVYCNFNSGATEVMHDTEKITYVDYCHGPGCYHKNISYINGLTSQPISEAQILPLIELAEYCHQEFRFDTLLFPPNRNGSDIAGWKDRQWQDNSFSKGTNHGRDCRSDLESEHLSTWYRYCYNEKGWFYGNLTDMTALPIMRMYFGDLQNLEENDEVGAFQISRLKCFGEKDVENATSWGPPSSCSSLKKRGVMISGYYHIKPADTEYVKLVFCDMKSNSYTDVVEENIRIEETFDNKMSDLFQQVAENKNDIVKINDTFTLDIDTLTETISINTLDISINKNKNNIYAETIDTLTETINTNTLGISINKNKTDNNAETINTNTLGISINKNYWF